MGLSKRLSKRLTALEARQAHRDVLGDRWPSMDCDPARINSRSIFVRSPTCFV